MKLLRWIAEIIGMSMKPPKKGNTISLKEMSEKREAEGRKKASRTISPRRNFAAVFRVGNNLHRATRPSVRARMRGIISQTTSKLKSSPKSLLYFGSVLVALLLVLLFSDFF